MKRLLKFFKNILKGVKKETIDFCIILLIGGIPTIIFMLLIYGIGYLSLRLCGITNFTAEIILNIGFGIIVIMGILFTTLGLAFVTIRDFIKWIIKCWKESK